CPGICLAPPSGLFLAPSFLSFPLHRNVQTNVRTSVRYFNSKHATVASPQNLSEGRHHEETPQARAAQHAKTQTPPTCNTFTLCNTFRCNTFTGCNTFIPCNTFTGCNTFASCNTFIACNTF